MWRIDFYLLPSSSYHDIDEYEAFEFGEKVAYLCNNEKMYVPDEFYGISDKNGITAMDYLYGKAQSDISDYLMEVISKQKTSSDTYFEIKNKAEYGYLPITQKDLPDNSKHLCVMNIKNVEEDKCLKVNDVIKIKRFYIKRVVDYKIYADRVRECFPNIIFHDDAFKHVEKLGKCVDIVEELTRHLTVLNDNGKKLYDYHNKNEKDTLAELKSGYDIICSGKGSNEEKSYNKEIIYNDKKFQLTCNPHTKLYNKRTDQRIYFCWGRDEIENHRIIVVRIGDHWDE